MTSFLSKTLMALLFMGIVATASADQRDLIVLVSVTDKAGTTSRADLQQYIVSALKKTPNESCKPTVTVIPRRLYERVSRMMRQVANGGKLLSDGTVSEVKDQLTHWHIESREGVTPARVALKWRELGNEQAFEQVFVVQKQGTSNAIATAQEVAKNTVLVRSNESWDILGYRLEWDGISNPKDGYAAWPSRPPTYLVVLRGFDDTGDELQKLYTALREDVGEILKIESPRRALKLVSIDLEPDGWERGPVWSGSNFVLSVAPFTPWRKDVEPLAWVLFPLSADEKDEVVDRIRKLEAVADESGQVTVAKYILDGSLYPLVKRQKPKELVRDLPADMPQPTATLDRALRAQWYEVPAETNPDGTLRRFARTVQVQGEPDPALLKDRHWMVIVYARDIKGDWLAGQPSDEQKKVGTKYSTTRDDQNFIPFFQQLFPELFPKGAKQVP